MAAAVGGSPHAAVEAVVAYAVRHGGDPVAPVPGRPERLDPYKLQTYGLIQACLAGDKTKCAVK